MILLLLTFNFLEINFSGILVVFSIKVRNMTFLIIAWAQANPQKSVLILIKITNFHKTDLGPWCSSENYHTEMSSFLVKILLMQPGKEY